jgi:hypothetical protein
LEYHLSIVKVQGREEMGVSIVLGCFCPCFGNGGKRWFEFAARSASSSFIECSELHGSRPSSFGRGQKFEGMWVKFYISVPSGSQVNELLVVIAGGCECCGKRDTE